MMIFVDVLLSFLDHLIYAGYRQVIFKLSS